MIKKIKELVKKNWKHWLTLGLTWIVNKLKTNKK